MRNPVTVVFIVVCVAAFATAMGASGTATWLGVESPSIGAAEDVDESEENLGQYKASRNKDDVNFIGSVFSAFDTFLGAFVIIKNLQTYLVNAGLPGWAAVFLASPVVWSLGTFAIYFISGRQEVTPR
jgi:hypothetical protein